MLKCEASGGIVVADARGSSEREANNMAARSGSGAILGAKKRASLRKLIAAALEVIADSWRRGLRRDN
jgi:hypothetical protein